MGSTETFKIFCGNLAPTTTSDDLHELFGKFGTVVEAVVKTGKNFGFVHMSSEAHGLKALYRLQGYLLNGEKMVVQRAINNRKAVSLTPHKRGLPNQQNNSMDDFDSYYENFTLQASENHDDFMNHHTQDMSSINQHFSPSPNHMQQHNIQHTITNQQQPITNNLQQQPTISNNSNNISLNFNDNNCHSEQSPTSLTPNLTQSIADHAMSISRQDNNFNQNNQSEFSNKEIQVTCGICGQLYRKPSVLGSSNNPFCPDCLISLSKPSETKTAPSNSFFMGLGKGSLGGFSMGDVMSFPQQDVLSNFISSQNCSTNQNQPQPQQTPLEICCQCLCIPPNTTCLVRKHEIIKETDADQVLKNKLKSMLDFSLTNLRAVMTLRANLKERMQYTLHSLTKFSEELQMKIEGEEMEEAVQHSLLGDLHQANDSLYTINSTTELLTACNKVKSYSQSISTQYETCLATTAINDALDAILLKLKRPVAESNMGFAAEEAFSLGSTLKEQAEKGNFANVLLLYLLCDLLATRHRPTAISPLSPQAAMSPVAHSGAYSASPLISIPSTEPDEIISIKNNPSTCSDEFDINQVIETTQAIELSETINGNISPNNFETSNAFSPPTVSSALSFGLTNFQLLASDSSSSEDESEEIAKVEDKTASTVKPVSYLDAVKKPAKPMAAIDNQNKQIAKAVPSPIKSMKFPHCWMVISVDQEVIGRIVFQLRPDKAPKMCDNFINLCTGKCGYGYKDTHFFKNGDGFLVGGDVENDDGTGGYSYNNKQKFEADLCPLKDDVGMVRFKGIGTSDNGRGMVGSQFMIWYTEREFKKFSFSLVFGRVVDGLDIVQQIATYNLHKVAVKVEQSGAI